jgi:hypothetical protein
MNNEITKTRIPYVRYALVLAGIRLGPMLWAYTFPAPVTVVPQILPGHYSDGSTNQTSSEVHPAQDQKFGELYFNQLRAQNYEECITAKTGPSPMFCSCVADVVNNNVRHLVNQYNIRPDAKLADLGLTEAMIKTKVSLTPAQLRTCVNGSQI